MILSQLRMGARQAKNAPLFKGTLAIHDVIAINALYVKAALWGFEA